MQGVVSSPKDEPMMGQCEANVLLPGQNTGDRGGGWNRRGGGGVGKGEGHGQLSSEHLPCPSVCVCLCVFVCVCVCVCVCVEEFCKKNIRRQSSP